MGTPQENLSQGVPKTKVASVKLKMLPLPFLFSSLFPFFLSFSFAAVISQLIERKIKSLSFGPFFTASLGSFSKNQLDIRPEHEGFYTQTEA